LRRVGDYKLHLVSILKQCAIFWHAETTIYAKAKFIYFVTCDVVGS